MYELYDGDQLVGYSEVIPAGYCKHEHDGVVFGVKAGTGCPNRRFGCDFVAPQDDGEWELDRVMVITEAAELAGVGETAVRNAIHRGTFTARKSAGTWLVLRSDVMKRWPLAQ